MIDEQGFRPNVGIILANDEKQLFWAERIRQKNAWQFPQGGMKFGETPEQAMYRELREEIGLLPTQVRVLGNTHDWLYYRLPKAMVRHDQDPPCIGQKQIWFLLQLLVQDHHFRLDMTATPEFYRWRWVDYWHPLTEVVSFKRSVYKRALNELAPILENSIQQKQSMP